MTTATAKSNREVLLTARMTIDEASRLDKALKRLNADRSSTASRITRSTLTRMGIEMLLSQMEAA